MATSSPPSRRVPCLVALTGADSGARLVVTREGMTIGRAPTMDLALSDRSISRHHLVVAPADGGVLITCAKDARAFVHRDAPTTSAIVHVGERIIVGETIFTVAQVVQASEPAADATTTEVESLLSGIAGDVQAFAAVISLIDALATVSDVGALEAALRTWATAHADADRVTLMFLEPGDKLAPEITERPDAGTLLTVPVPADPPARLTFHTTRRAERISDTYRRILVVAGVVCSSTLTRLRMNHELEHERETLRQLAVGSARGFLGASPAALEIAKLLPRLASSDATVMLLGETGVGKSFLARLIHENGPRAKEPLRTINCAAIPEALVESELFGHERGAFSGAVAARAGAFEAAGAGTLFLDEVGELPLATQAKLLRVLEERTFERIGSNRSVPLRARVLVATNRNLEEMIKEGRFRQDLYYRLCVVQVHVPALRERGEDVVELARQILGDLASSAGRRVDGFSPDALDVIRTYPWPGNVRELRNCIERALVLGDGRFIEPEDFPVAIRGAQPQPVDDPFTLKLPAPLEVIESRGIEAALLTSGGNRTQAAALLGITRQTLWAKLKSEKPGSVDD